MKMLYECRATHMYFMGELGSRIPLWPLFLIWLEGRSSSSQIRPNKKHMFLAPKCLCCPVLSQSSTIAIYFLCTTNKNVLSFVWESDAITLTGISVFFFTITLKEMKILLWNIICMFFCFRFIAYILNFG